MSLSKPTSVESEDSFEEIYADHPETVEEMAERDDAAGVLARAILEAAAEDQEEGDG